MKTIAILALLVALPLAGCATRKVTYDQIQDRVAPNGELLPYLKGEAQPFIVARQALLRTQIDAIVAELEGGVA